MLTDPLVYVLDHIATVWRWKNKLNVFLSALTKRLLQRYFMKLSIHQKSSVHYIYFWDKFCSFSDSMQNLSLLFRFMLIDLRSEYSS